MSSTGDGGGKGAAVAVGIGSGISLAGLLTLVTTESGRKTLDDIATWVIHLHGANPWLVYVELAVVGYVVFGYVLGEFLRGAYPPEMGTPPRFVAGMIRLSRGPRVVIRGLGRWAAKRSTRFGFDFEDDEQTKSGTQKSVLGLNEEPKQ